MIIQITVYVCDQCKETKVESKEVAIWADPSVSLPEGWTVNKNQDVECYNCGCKNVGR